MTIGRLTNEPVPVPTTRQAIKMEAMASCIFLSVEAFGALSIHMFPIYPKKYNEFYKKNIELNFRFGWILEYIDLPFESENKPIINIKSASLLNKIFRVSSSEGMLQYINSGIKVFLII